MPSCPWVIPVALLAALLSEARLQAPHAVSRRGLWLQGSSEHQHRGGGGGGGTQVLVGEHGRGPVGPEFFEDVTTDVGGSTETSAVVGNRKVDTCHPKCEWTCEESKCNANCKPICRAPVCMTACEKPRVSECKQVCEDPKCAVVCPKSPCAHSDCPGCTTVCGEPKCKLDCSGGRFCRSTCADPVCAWNCTREACPEPKCSLRCDTPKFCSLEKPQPTTQEVYLGHDDQTLDGMKGYAVEYVNREVAWKGLAATPMAQGALLPGGVGPLGGAVPPSIPDIIVGAKALPPRPCASFCKPTLAPAAADGEKKADDDAARPPCKCGYEATLEEPASLFKK